MYTQGPYGAPPTYGAQPGYGAAPVYGAAPSPYGQDMYGQPPMYGPPPGAPPQQGGGLFANKSVSFGLIGALIGLLFPPVGWLWGLGIGFGLGMMT